MESTHGNTYSIQASPIVSNQGMKLTRVNTYSMKQ